LWGAKIREKTKRRKRKPSKLAIRLS